MYFWAVGEVHDIVAAGSERELNDIDIHFTVGMMCLSLYALKG